MQRRSKNYTKVSGVRLKHGGATKGIAQGLDMAGATLARLFDEAMGNSDVAISVRLLGSAATLGGSFGSERSSPGPAADARTPSTHTLTKDCGSHALGAMHTHRVELRRTFHPWWLSPLHQQWFCCPQGPRIRASYLASLSLYPALERVDPETVLAAEGRRAKGRILRQMLSRGLVGTLS